MRKLFYFILAAVMVVLAACGDGNNPETKKFQITITKVSNTSVKVEYSAVDKSKSFICGKGKSADFLTNPEKVAQESADVLKQLNNPDFLHQDNYAEDITDLEADVEYAIWACEVDDNYKVVGQVEYVLVKNGEVQGGEDPQEPEIPQDDNIPAPTGLTVLAVSHPECEYRTIRTELSWNKVAGATSYKVYRKDICIEHSPLDGLIWGEVMVANRVIATVTEPSYTDSTDPYHTTSTGAWPHHMETEYTITAITSKGESKPSEAVTVEWENGECFH